MDIERRTQPAEAVPHPRLDRAQGHAEKLGDLALGIATVVGQDQRLPLNVAQPRERGERLAPVQRPFHLFGDGHSDGSVAKGSAHLALGGRPRRSHTVDRPASGDGEHPCHDRGPVRAVGRGAPPHLEQHLLRHLLGLRGAAQRPQHHAVDRRRHGGVQHSEGLLVAARHQGHESAQLIGR